MTAPALAPATTVADCGDVDAIAGCGLQLLAQVRRHRRVVAERLVEVPGVGPVVARGHLAERGPELATDTLCLGHERAPDAALPGARIHDEREDPDDPVVVLEPG